MLAAPDFRMQRPYTTNAKHKSSEAKPTKRSHCLDTRATLVVLVALALVVVLLEAPVAVTNVQPAVSQTYVPGPPGNVLKMAALMFEYIVCVTVTVP